MLIKKEKVEEIRMKLAVFDFKRLQELITLSNVLEKEELSLEDVENFIETSLEISEFRRVQRKIINETRQKQWEKGARKCPICRKPLTLRSINIPKGKGNVHGYSCHWYCLEETCTFEEYTKEDFKEIYKKIMEG